MNILWWHWLVLGLVLIGLELVVPSFTIVWFGLGAVLVGVFTALLPGFTLPAQILTWTVVSALLTFAWFRFFKQKSRTVSGTAKDGVIGETGLVVRGAGPYEKGRVRFQLPLLGSDEWPCMADEPLQVGDRVRVMDLEGHVMKVEKTDKGVQG